MQTSSGRILVLAPGITSGDVSDPLTFDEKVRIFEASVLGWQLEIAATILDGGPRTPPIRDSGYAALSIIGSYPEMIWQFLNGQSSSEKSRKAFREGLASIFDSVDLDDPAWIESADLVYSELRCGLYHEGRARSRVVTRADFAYPIAVDKVDGLIHINPHRLVPAFIKHFHEYVVQIRGSGETGSEGQRFTAAFDMHWYRTASGAWGPKP